MQKRFDRESGSALIAAFWMMVVLLLAAMAASYTTSTEIGLAGNERQETQLFYLAEAGLAQCKKYLDGLGVPFEGGGPNFDTPVQQFLDEPVGVTGAQGTFTAYIDPMDRRDGKPNRYVAITVRARMPNSPMVQVVQELVGQENFARYSHFTNLETRPDGEPMWFITGDILRGPVHSNSQLNINGDPVFMQVVTSTASGINYGAGPNDPDFRDELTFNVDQIVMPSDTNLLSAKAQEPEGLYFTGNADLVLDYNPITFFASVSVDLGTGPTVYQIPDNGVLYVDGDVTIKGTLGGQLTVGCSGDMYINDDIIYTTDPRVDPNSDDILGLVAGGDVIVAATTENLDSGDETIMAVIMALNESFTVENYDQGTPRGTLFIVGGVVQTRRGPLGTFNSETQQIFTGYAKDYYWDARLVDSTPPYFPTTGRVVTLSWKEMEPNYDISINVF